MDSNGHRKYQCVNVMLAGSQMHNLSRHELLDWINRTYGYKLTKVESLCSGGIYCKLLDLLFPGCLSLKKIKFDANKEHEYHANLKALQRTLGSVGCNKDVPIDKLMKGRLQDNLEFLQWFKKFFDANFGLHSYSDMCAKILKDPQQAKLLHESVQSSKKLAEASEHPIQIGNNSHLNTREKAKFLQDQIGALQDQASEILEERNIYYSKLKQVECFCLEKCDVNDSVQALTEKILEKLYEGQEEEPVPED